MDKPLITRRFAKATGTYARESSVQQQIAGKMARLLQQYLPPRPPMSVVEVGCGTGTFSRMLLSTLHPRRLLLNDICEEMLHTCRGLLSERVAFLPGDAEAIALPSQTELITSCSALQWFETPETFFRRCNHSLAPQGHFAFSTFGRENMREIRRLTGQGLPYRSRQELEASLAPLFEIVHAEEEIITLRFDTPLQVLWHLKQTGVTGTGRKAWTRSDLDRFCQQYEALFGHDSGTVRLTYHPIYIIAKKKEV